MILVPKTQSEIFFLSIWYSISILNCINVCSVSKVLLYDLYPFHHHPYYIKFLKKLASVLSLHLLEEREAVFFSWLPQKKNWPHNEYATKIFSDNEEMEVVPSSSSQFCSHPVPQDPNLLVVGDVWLWGKKNLISHTNKVLPWLNECRQSTTWSLSLRTEKSWVQILRGAKLTIFCLFKRS